MENRRDEKRGDVRVDVHVTLPILLVRVENEESLECRLCDISSSGIGVLVGLQLTPGERVTLKTIGRDWLLEVTWCEGEERSFKCGLDLVDKTKDLESLFSSYKGYKLTA